MAEVKLLKIYTDGIPTEMDITADQVTLASFSVYNATPGEEQVLSATGLELSNTDITGLQDLNFEDPTTGIINLTAGDLIVDDIMGVDRVNTMDVDAAIQFPVVLDDADELSAFRLPAIAGTPTAAPTSGVGTIVYDSAGDKLWLYVDNGVDPAYWDDLSTVYSANNVDNIYTADVALTASQAVYISAADSVSPAKGDALATARCIGFAVANAAEDADVYVRSEGIIGGLSGLTAGGQYYLSAATAGAITGTVPTGTGQIIMQVGFAKNTTDLKIQLQYLGRRA